MSNNKGKGGVWEYFTIVAAAGAQKRVKCGKCHTTLSYNQGSTSSMLNHLERVHTIHSAANSSQHDGASASKQPKLDSFLACKAMLPSSSAKATRLTNNIVKMVCLDLQPMSLVKDTGFRSLMAEAYTRFVIPTRKSLRNNVIPALYSAASTQVKMNIAAYKENFRSNSLFGITTDGWTSSNTTSHLAYTLHIIEDYQLVSNVIGLAELSSKHTAHNLRAHLLGTLQHWEI